MAITNRQMQAARTRAQELKTHMPQATGVTYNPDAGLRRHRGWRPLTPTPYRRSASAPAATASTFRNWTLKRG